MGQHKPYAQGYVRVAVRVTVILKVWANINLMPKVGLRYDQHKPYKKRSDRSIYIFFFKL